MNNQYKLPDNRIAAGKANTQAIKRLSRKSVDAVYLKKSGRFAAQREQAPSPQ